MQLATRILIGLIAGVAVGLLFQGYITIGTVHLHPGIMTTWVQPIGFLFISLIMMLIVPLVLSTLVTGVASTGDIRRLGRVGGKSLFFFISTAAIAVTSGILWSRMFTPGSGLNLPTYGLEHTVREAPPVIDVLLNIVPRNAIQAMADGTMLQIICFAIFLGVAITMVGSKADPLKSFFDSLAEVMLKITEIVMKVAPFGVFALIAPVAATHGIELLLPLAQVIGVMYLAAAFHLIVFFGGIIKLTSRFSLYEFYKGMFPAMVVAFSTCSSAATLPVTIKCVTQNLKIPRKTASIVVPSGVVLNMDGSALYQGIAALFIAQAFGLDLTLGQMFTIVLTGTLASIGAAGVPGAGMIILSMVLLSVGLPVEGIALIAGIDRILDQARTTVNVTGDAVCCLFIEATERGQKFHPSILEPHEIAAAEDNIKS